ncbi:MAG: response regulator [Terriglobales bacterium]
MPLTILLADDSMTAQKMGKEILIGAGYEVIAVSNGAAAAKKLAEKPDIIILDVFMPGYTGLEICEKVRASIDTAKTPVLLTVGQMEHFDPQESARVKADGLIIKPFVASDLIATIKKIEEKMNAAAAAAETPAYEKTMILDRAQIQEFKDASYDEWKTDAAEEPPPLPMEMSQEMGSAPAFADDMMSAPAAPAFDETVNYPPAIPAAMPTTPSAAAAAPAFDETVNFPPAMPSPAPDISMDETVNFPPASAPSLDFTPISMDAPPAIMMDPVPSVPQAASEIEFTSAPRGLDAKIVVEEGLEADNIEVAAPMQDPALVTDASTMATEFVTKFGVEKEEEDNYVPGFDKPAQEVAAVAPPADDDFEARVAAAMNSYETEAPPAIEVVDTPEVEIVEVPAPEAPASIAMDAMPAPISIDEVAPEIGTDTAGTDTAGTDTAGTDTAKMDAVVEEYADAVIEVVEEAAAEQGVPVSQMPPEGMQDAALVEQMQQAFADLPVAPPAPVEEPVVQAAVAAIPEAPVAASNTVPDMELANALAAAVGGEPPPAAAPLAAAVAAASPGLDPHTIAAVVSRVMEKMLPSIMTEVAKELDNAKSK